MKTKYLANALGYASIICSSLFWVLLAWSVVSEHFPASLDLPFNGWALIWAVGLLLALIAAALGPRRWAFAALLPIVSLFAAVTLINLREPR